MKVIAFHDDNRRREVAYHEAGHAAILYFFGTFGDFGGISMTPDANTLGRVQSKACAWSPMLLEQLAQQNPLYAKSMGMKIIMLKLGGPCAENIVGERDEDWLQFLIDADWNEGDEENNDITNAIRTAFAAVGRTGRKPWTMLNRAAKWTEEAIGRPDLWRAIQALAGRLMVVDEMDAEVAWNIMEEAFGPSRQTPAYCGKWRRRFAVT